jgi:hypothetical protein
MPRIASLANAFPRASRQRAPQHNGNIAMSKKHESSSSSPKLSDEIEAMAGKSEDEGFKQDIYDAMKEKFIDINKQLGRVEEAEKIAANLATPVPGQDRLTPFAPPSAHKLYGTIKHFRDREIEGRTIRAVDQAYTAGMWFKATIPRQRRSQGVVQVARRSDHQGAGRRRRQRRRLPCSRRTDGQHHRASRAVRRVPPGMPVVPMGSDTLNWPRRTGGLTAFFTGENQAVTESQAAWDNVNLTAKKCAVLTRMSTEIEQDAVVAIADWLVGEMAYAFASKEDDCGFNGDGTSTYGGMRGLTVLAIDGAHNAASSSGSSRNTFGSSLC